MFEAEKLDATLFIFSFGLSALFLAPGGDEGGDDGNQDDARDNGEREKDWDIVLKPFGRIVVRIDEHFYADEYEDEVKAVFQITEIFNGSGEHEIQRA